MRYSFIPVGFHFMMALKRPMASSSVHGSLRMSSSFLLGDCAAGVGVLCWSVAAGEVACDTRARFLGGIWLGRESTVLQYRCGYPVAEVDCSACDCAPRAFAHADRSELQGSGLQRAMTALALELGMLLLLWHAESFRHVLFNQERR